MAIIISLVFIGLVSHNATGENGPRFNAISYSVYGRELYHKLKTEDAPYKTNPDNSANLHNWKYICAVITRDGFFKWLSLFPVSNQEIRHGWTKSKYRDIFNLMYNSPFDTNVYRQVSFNDGSRQWKEHVIVCPVRTVRNNRLSRHTSDEKVTPIYVTKEYNVGIAGQPYKPGRFVIAPRKQSYENHRIMCVEVFEDIILAEEAAKIYEQPDFNEELYYLQMKKYAEPVDDENIDPLCKMVSKELGDDQNQYQRICAVAGKLPDLRPEFAYVDPAMLLDCTVKQVFLRTNDGKTESKGESFTERMVRCPIQRVDQFYTVQVFVSRGYKSNEIFVFRHDYGNNKIFLENLYVGLSIADELNSFDFIED